MVPCIEPKFRRYEMVETWLEIGWKLAGQTGWKKLVGEKISGEKLVGEKNGGEKLVGKTAEKGFSEFGLKMGI